MDKKYLDLLPSDVRSLAEQIEHDSGVEISVTIDASRGATLACEVNNCRANLLTPSPTYFQDASVLHELLHIRRFLLEGVPKITVCHDYDNWTHELETNLTRLDNSLEHLIIVPEELENRPGRKAYWRAIMIRELDNNQSSNRAGDAILNWTFIKHVLPEPDLLKKAEEVIKLFSASEEATQFFNDLIPSLHSKKNAVQVCLKHLDIPREAVCLDYIDSRNAISRQIPVASVEE